MSHQRDVDRFAGGRAVAHVDLEVRVRLLRGAREHQPPLHAVAVGQPRDRQRAALDLEHDVVRSGQRRQVDRAVHAVERAAHHAVDAQQRTGAGGVAQPQRPVGERRVRDERDGRLVRAALGETNAHQRVAVSRSFALVQFARGAFFESST